MMPHAPEWPTAVITWVMEEVQRSLWQQQGQGEMGSGKSHWEGS